MMETYPGWRGAVDRFEAEKLLRGSPKGTYLLRKGDEYTRNIEEVLGLEGFGEVHCCLLTILEEEKKISEHILVQTEKGWTLFNDDLYLQEYEYKELSLVIEEAGGAQPLREFKKAA